MLRRARSVVCPATTASGLLEVTTFRFASAVTRETDGIFKRIRSRELAGSFAAVWEKLPKMMISGRKFTGFSPGTIVAPTTFENSGDAVLKERLGYMKTFKMMLVTVVAILVAGFALISAAAGPTHADDFDPAATYKAKCVACHGAAAEKKLDRKSVV